MDPSKIKTGLDVCHAKKYCGYRITYLHVVYIEIDLNLHMTKSYWRFMCDWCNLIHGNICWVNDCRTVPHNLIILSFFNDDTLSGVTEVW